MASRAGFTKSQRKPHGKQDYRAPWQACKGNCRSRNRPAPARISTTHGRKLPDARQFAKKTCEILRHVHSACKSASAGRGGPHNPIGHSDPNGAPLSIPRASDTAVASPTPGPNALARTISPTRGIGLRPVSQARQAECPTLFPASWIIRADEPDPAGWWGRRRDGRGPLPPQCTAHGPVRRSVMRRAAAVNGGAFRRRLGPR